jgi:hypothetical protein
MFVITKIEVYDIDGFAKLIASRIPEVEPDFYGFDEHKEWSNKEDFDFDIEVEGLVINVAGEVKAWGVSVKVMSQTYDHPAEYNNRQVNEIEDIGFYIEGEEVEVDNINDLVKRINELI